MKKSLEGIDPEIFIIKRITVCFPFVVIFCLMFRTYIVAIDVTKQKPNWWLEVWGDIGYQRTNGWYEVEKNFYISALSPKVGYRLYLKNFLFIDPYYKVELRGDLGNKENNRFFWNNSIKYGPGVRVRLENKKWVDYNKDYSFRFTYANLDCYIEYLNITFFERGMEVPSDVPKKDVNFGLTSWISADNNKRMKKIFAGMWFEMWSAFIHYKTNFFQKGKEKFLILTMCPKAGLRIAQKGFALETYLRLDFVRDFFNRDWNKEAWSNNIKYGPGIRLSIGGFFIGGVLRRPDTPTIHVYSDFLYIDYFSRTGWKSLGLSKKDFRAGINVWMPFGASKGIWY